MSQLHTAKNRSVFLRRTAEMMEDRLTNPDEPLDITAVHRVIQILRALSEPANAKHFAQQLEDPGDAVSSPYTSVEMQSVFGPKRFKSKRQCSIPDCYGPISARGVCNPHYFQLHTEVQSGSTTWEELEHVGLTVRPSELHAKAANARSAQRALRENGAAQPAAQPEAEEQEVSIEAFVGIVEHPTECLRPGCHAKPHGRGLCTTDYNTVARLVKEGRTSWGELEKKGKILPQGRYRKRGANKRDTVAEWALREDG